MIVAGIALAYLLVPLICIIMAGGDSWLEPTLESMPDRARIVRLRRPVRFDLN